MASRKSGASPTTVEKAVLIQERLADADVLLVDDELFMRRLIGSMLRMIGIKKVEMAENGAIALRGIVERSTLPDLMVCDLEMPEMDGLTLLTHLRALPLPHDLPVIILTSHSNIDNIKNAVELGIHGFLAKPVTLNDLRAKVLAALTQGMIDTRRVR
jgi:two-component system, chemotaxis family, chemotaxis protein CheY